MVTITLIGEPFPDREAAVHAEATFELAQALAETAPEGCAVRVLLPADRPEPTFTAPLLTYERLPMRAAMLPTMWRSGITARPLDGEFMHAATPLAPLRRRGDDDYSQASVMVPHALGWLAPDEMGAAEARQYRAFVKRAKKHADVVITPNHATAAAVQKRYGTGLTIQVLPLAVPSAYRAGDDAAARRAALRLPERYTVTTAGPTATGRLEWILSAMVGDPALPPLVVIAGAVPLAELGEAAAEAAPDAPAAAAPEPAAFEAATVDAPFAIPDAVRSRVHIVRPTELADIGAILAGAQLLALPQLQIGTGFEVLGALAAGVPVLHSGCAVVNELALDGGVAAPTHADFAAALTRLRVDHDELTRLAVLAEDRSRTFNWNSTAMSLWELHANI